MKRYAEYKDSGIEWIGEIPKDWERTKLKHIGTVKGRIGFKGYAVTDLVDEYVQGRAIVLGGTNIMKDGTVSYNKLTYLSEYKYLESPEIMLYGGEILITKVGAGTGESALYDYYDERMTINPNVMIFVPLKRVNSRFINYYLLSVYVKCDISIESNKSGAQPAINQEFIKNIKIVLPSFEKQVTIASYLDHKTTAIDAIVDDKQKLIALLKEKRQTIISEAVTKGLDKNAKMKDSGIEWIGEIPEEWEIKRLKFIAKKPLMYGTNESAESDNINFPRYIRITDIDEAGSLKSDTFKSLPPDKASLYLLEKNDILFARSGASVGKTYIHKDDLVACFAGYLIKLSVDNEIADSRFVYYNTFTDRYFNWIKENTIQATIQNVSAEKYNNYEIAIPSLDVQQIIINYLDEKNVAVNSLIADIQTQIEKLKEYRQSIISEAVTGKVMIEC